MLKKNYSPHHNSLHLVLICVATLESTLIEPDQEQTEFLHLKKQKKCSNVKQLFFSSVIIVVFSQKELFSDDKLVVRREEGISLSFQRACAQARPRTK